MKETVANVWNILRSHSWDGGLLACKGLAPGMSLNSPAKLRETSHTRELSALNVNSVKVEKF